MKKFILGIVSFSIVCLFACDSDETSSPTVVDDKETPIEDDTYDATALLTSWVNNHIIVDYTEFAELTQDLVEAKDTFINDNSVTNLAALKSSYLTAYFYFQRIGMYNVGLADSINYYLFLNVYPTTIASVDSNISNGFSAKDLESVFEQPTQGFSALDYLLNGLADTEKGTLTALTNAHLDYLSVLVDKIDSLTDQILADWNDGYGDTFIANSGSDINGSPNVFYNALIYYFENNIRRQKIDIPAGVFTTNTFSDKIESLYDEDQSRDLLLEAFQQFESFYIGSESDTESLSTALISIGREDLDTAIKDQFNIAEAAISGLGKSIKEQVETNNTSVLQVRNEIQKLVNYFKLDVPSALDFSILFADNDGD